MNNRYYFNELDNNVVTISGGEAQHLSKVRRSKRGDNIVSFNGDGFDYNLTITEITKDKVKAEIVNKTLNKAITVHILSPLGYSK